MQPTLVATQGDTLTLRTPQNDTRPAQGWACSVRVAGVITIDVAAPAQGDDFVAVIDSAKSEALGAGTWPYVWVARQGTTVQRALERGVIKLEPLFSASPSGIAGQSFARQRLKALEAQILGLDQLVRYGSGDRTAERRSLESLYQERGRLKREIAAEEREALGDLRGPSFRFRMPLKSGRLC